MMRPIALLAAVLCLLMAPAALAQEPSPAPSTDADTSSPAPSSAFGMSGMPTEVGAGGTEDTPEPTAEPTSGSYKAATVMAGVATAFAAGAWF